MDTHEKIESEMKDAMKQKDSLKLSVLRMAIAAIRNTEIVKKVKKLEEPEVLQVIQKLIKEHRESIDQFEKGNRPDLVEKETKELEVLQRYVPKEMDIDELTSIVKTVVQESGFTSKADAGKVMKTAMERVKGRADGKIVNNIVLSLLK
ncbi:MAG: GatB/YqeY domain-containing protein [Candidatus Omnitrophota bacterium]|nr:GatB/YqeY domain-containing protein [Candidatus Omnitrophota bacterium]